ncbi:MAG: DeoR/GlpR transcriptional regulator [Gloeobacteraceae cyanobacterium ES-bin-316]|nr:DeoR/GlpR transcriptional regulator [Ferruginibacter sp.]
MLKKERQAFILHEVNLHNRVLSSDLSINISVSEDTVRRDLQELSEMGKLIKVHGGALSNSFSNSFNSGKVYSIENKKSIAQKAVTLIKDGMFILTSGGTTIIELAKALPESLHATFITGSLPAALEYSHHPNIEIIFIGDKVSKNSQITVGGEAIAKIGQIRADICFLGINALDVDQGMTDNDWEVVQLKKAMIASSSVLVSLSISEKLNTSQPIKVCDAGDIDILITELEANAPLLKTYKKAGIEIL